MSHLSQTVRKSLAGGKGAYDLSALSHFSAIIWRGGQERLTPFSTGQLMAYKIKKFKTVQLNSIFHFDSPNLPLLKIIYSSIFRIIAVSKHVIVA